MSAIAPIVCTHVLYFFISIVMTNESTRPVALNARIAPEIHRALKIKAAQSGRSMRQILEESLRRACDMHDRADSDNSVPVDGEAPST